MQAQEFYDNLPENFGAERNNYTQKAVESGLMNPTWYPVGSVTHNDNGSNDILTVFISSDALHVSLDNKERFRPMFSASTSQKAADALDAMLITAKVSDLSYAQVPAERCLNACILPATNQMSNTSYSKNWNKKLENLRKGYEGLLMDVGKPFILDNSIATSKGATLYGFYDLGSPYKNAQGIRMWQTVGTKHDVSHMDYSSVCRLMKKTAIYNGEEVSIKDIAKDPKLSKMINYGGVLQYLRY